MFPNLTESIEQTFPISLDIPKFDKSLLSAPTDLKDFISIYTKHKEIFHLQEKHDSDSMELNTNKNFFSDNYKVDIFMFMSAEISPLATTLLVYLLCKHKKL